MRYRGSNAAAERENMEGSDNIVKKPRLVFRVSSLISNHYPSYVYAFVDGISWVRLQHAYNPTFDSAKMIKCKGIRIGRTFSS